MKKPHLQPENQEIAVVGGLGHVGLPLGLALAQQGFAVHLCDPDRKKTSLVLSGKMPFLEEGAEELLPKVLASGKLKVCNDNSAIAQAKTVIVCLGTPVDEYLNPQLRVFFDIIETLKIHSREGQLWIIRSTVFPRTIAGVDSILNQGRSKGAIDVAYCPERIVQGLALKELSSLPQVVAGVSQNSFMRAKEIFETLSPEIVKTEIAEAELVKLYCNAWRYIQFAVANQFYMLSEKFGVDYNTVRTAMMKGYGRASALPKAGFAAGPCLLKDTMQLAAFSGNQFAIGVSSMQINEGLPNFIVDQLLRDFDLKKETVGILGMAFKADSDDIRDSLSYKLGKLLRFHGAKVLYTDEYVSDPTFTTKEDLMNRASIVIVGAPHSAYSKLRVRPDLKVIDTWGILDTGALDKGLKSKEIQGSKDLPMV